MFRRALVVLALVLTVAACSDAPAPAAHDAADVTFAQMMIPHHAAAVAMAAQAPTRASSPRVKDLARRIEAAQGPEIAEMNAMLASWGAPTVPPAGEAAPAMDGPDFDRAFLAMMTEHHAGAITMARTELAQGRDPRATALAAAIVAGQQREIGEMQALLAAP